MDQLNISVQAHDVALLPQLPFDQSQFHLDAFNMEYSNHSSQKHNPTLQVIQNLISSRCSPALLLALIELLSDAFRPCVKTLLFALDSRIVTHQEIREALQASLSHSLIDQALSQFAYHQPQQPQQEKNICSPISADCRLSGGTLRGGMYGSRSPWNFNDSRASLKSDGIQPCSEDLQLWQNQMAPEPLLPHSSETRSGNDDASLSFTSTLPQSSPAQIQYYASTPISQVLALQDLDFLNEDKFQFDNQTPELANTSSDCVTGFGANTEQSAQDQELDEKKKTHASPETKTSQTRDDSLGRNFIAFKPRKSKARDRPFFCPECTKDFTSPREFLCHMNAVHDKPTEFRCKHFVTTASGKQSRCNHRSFVSSRYRRHHTTDHLKCTMLDEGGCKSSSCCQEFQNPQPRRFWGCGICVNLSDKVEASLKHHIEFHKDHDRSAISHTTLIRSYLSHAFIRPVWREALREIYPLTDATWQLQSSLGQDPSRHKIMIAFKTGLWDGLDIYTDLQTCRDMIAALMKMIEQDRPKKDNLPHEPSTTDRHSSSPLGRTKSFCSTLLKKRSKSVLRQPNSDADVFKANSPQLPTNHNYLTSK